MMPVSDNDGNEVKDKDGKVRTLPLTVSSQMVWKHYEDLPFNVTVPHVPQFQTRAGFGFPRMGFGVPMMQQQNVAERTLYVVLLQNGVLPFEIDPDAATIALTGRKGDKPEDVIEGFSHALYKDTYADNSGLSPRQRQKIRIVKDALYLSGIDPNEANKVSEIYNKYVFNMFEIYYVIDPIPMELI
jgi:hypothetical protein